MREKQKDMREKQKDMRKIEASRSWSVSSVRGDPREDNDVMWVVCLCVRPTRQRWVED